MGKGDKRRPTHVSDQEVARRWQNTFQRRPVPVTGGGTNIKTKAEKRDGGPPAFQKGE